MTPPATISILGKTWCQAESLEQFRRQEPTNRSRREGMKYYILYCAPGESPFPKGGQGDFGVLIQQAVTSSTDPTWLDEAIKLGSIYLEEIDFNLTKSAIQV